MNYAEIGFQRKIGEKDTLTYEGHPNIGDLVKIPLRNRLINGIVISKSANKPSYRTRGITEICCTSLLREWQIQLMLWISDYYMCPLNKALKLFVPKKVFEQNKMRPRKAKIREIKIVKGKNLTPSQREGFDRILRKGQLFLLHGITGSGKTEIYAQLSQKCKKQVLILVPEISLTPQTVEYFEKTVGEPVVVIHSRLTEVERAQSWLKIKSGEIRIIIGSRSAIFSPFYDLGLLIIDEEHEPSYKQEQSPRYDARKVALKMSEILPDLRIVFGSATPSIETFKNKKIAHVELNERIDATPLPNVEIADLREELKKGNYSIFSDTLFNKIEQTLKKKAQIILFLNRRGSASALICRDCGFKVQCKDCNVCMTYHKIKSRLICHHCGITTTPPINCPICKSVRIKYAGIGTQKIEEEVKKTFPRARILRADRDTVSKKGDFEKIYSDFREHKADILIGTQMIGKGLHLPRVNLVGVILADIGLGIPDFRSSERTFQLLTQVAGRAGRGKKQGEVVIQTYEPDHPTIQHAKTHNYNDFIAKEYQIRKILGYPPFSKLVKLTFVDMSEQKCMEETEKLENTLISINDGTQEITSYPALITKQHGKYHYNILVKSKNPREFVGKIEIPPGWKIDVDPISIN